MQRPPTTRIGISEAKKTLAWEPKVTLNEGVKILLKDMNYWKDAPIWDKNSIAKATEKWFEYLG